MDPVTALSVAGTIVQFVDFGHKLLTSSVELYTSSRGKLKGHEELEYVTIDLQAVVIKLRGCFSIAPAENLLVGIDHGYENSFLKICDEAAQIADDILLKLNGLKVKDGKHRAWESLKVAVKAAWSNYEVESLRRRLSVLKESLNSQAMLLLGQKIDTTSIRSSARFDSLDTQTQQILDAILGIKEGLTHEIIEVIAKVICRSGAVNQDAYHQTRQIICHERNDSTSPSAAMDIITAQIEMLSVGDEDEKRLR